MKWKLWPCLPAFLFCVSAFPQSGADTAFITAAKNYAFSLHQTALHSQSRLYNGSKYREPDFDFEQHPFFLSEDWITGSLFYDGALFTDVPLMYDLMNEVLVTEHTPSGHPIQLVREKLRYFTLQGHYFERIENESVGNSLPGTAFYDILYNGTSRLVARRQKFLRQEIEDKQIQSLYPERNRYFILMNGVYFPVKTKASILRLMGDKKQEIKKALRKQGVHFSDDRERALITVAGYYDSL